MVKHLLPLSAVGREEIYHLFTAPVTDTDCHPEVGVAVDNKPVVADSKFSLKMEQSITLTEAVLFVLIALLHEPDCKLVIVIVVVPALANAAVVKVPVPAVETIIEAVNPDCKFGALRS
jgi:hypothetical protein